MDGSTPANPTLPPPTAKRSVAFKLTLLETTEKAQKIAELITKKDEIEVEKKAAASRYKTQQEALDLEISDIARVLKEGSEYRPVDCYWVVVGAHKRLVRCDTGEVIEEVALTADERQAELDLREAEEPEVVEAVVEVIPESRQLPAEVPGKPRRSRRKKAEEVTSEGPEAA